MKRKSNNDTSYEKFKQKIFLQSVCMMGISILIIGAIYLFVWRGKGGDWIALFLRFFFGMSRGDAVSFYFYNFRNNSELIFLVAVAVIFIILLRFSLKRLTQYFDSINNGISALIDGDGSYIVLLPEMEAIEKKLNAVRLALDQRSHDAQLAEQRKNDLILYLAHDIKTPLTSVIGYLSMLAEAPDMPTEQRAKYMHIALDKAYRLEQLIDEFFEITRYSFKTMTLTKINIDLYYMLVQMVDEFYPQLAANGKQAGIHAPEDLTVYGDPDKLARVFNNILKNAAAYSEDNSIIDITAGLSGDMVTIVFKNSGSIPKEKLDAIFEKFYRLDDARSSNTGGMGLGLAIAKEIIAQHGGKIYAESDAHCTTFTVELPALPDLVYKNSYGG